MSATEARQYGSIGSRSKVVDFFLSASADELTATVLDIFVVQDLKDFLQHEVCMPLNMHPADSLEAGGHVMVACGRKRARAPRPSWRSASGATCAHTAGGLRPSCLKWMWT